MDKSLQKYLFIEVNLKYYFNKANSIYRPILLYSKRESCPTILKQTNNNLIILSDYSDKNGFYLEKKYLYNIIEKDENFNFQNNVCVSLLIDQLEDFIEYSIKISSSNTKPCPNSCSGSTNGVCVNGNCICNQEYLDEDCSVIGSQLKNDGKWLRK